MKATHKLILTGMILGVYCASGADIPSGSDLATMNDYYYYRDAGTSLRAQHALKYGGEYTLSVDKVWSALSVGTVLDEPAILNLCGHTLTLNGCDSTMIRPLTGNDNTTLVISNGTVRSVYDPVTYPWTNTSGEQYYSQNRGVFLSKNSNSAVGSRLIVANGGKLILDDHADAKVAWKGGGHSLVVENGGTFDGRLGFSGKENRYVFKSGATFSKISSYIGVNGNFPKNIYFENGYTSNVVEICDSDMLTMAGVTGLTPDANAKKGSFHCGLAVSSENFRWLGSGINIGTQDDDAPVLFEMKDGATMTMSGELLIGTKIGGSRSLMTLDGVGTAYKATGNYAGRVGSVANVTNVVLRLTNGAEFSAGNADFNVGYNDGTSYNALEVLSGSHFQNGTLTVGRTLSYGNRVLVVGEGSTMTNSAINLGNTASGGEHSMTVADGGSVFVFGKINVGYGSKLVVSNGTVTAGSGIGLGTNGLMSVAGQCAFIETASGGMIFERGGTLKIAVPREGFTDRNGAPRVPVNITGTITFDDVLTFEVDVSEMGRRHGDVKETPLLYVSSGISDGLLDKITVIGENCKVKRSSDGKTLKAVKSNGLVLFVR